MVAKTEQVKIKQVKIKKLNTLNKKNHEQLTKQCTPNWQLRNESGC